MDMDADAQVVAAARRYVALKTRAAHPKGHFDNGRRWWPAADESCDGECRVRTPSRAHPYSLLVHCRTAAHVARLFGVDRAALLRAAKQIEREQTGA